MKVNSKKLKVLKLVLIVSIIFSQFHIAPLAAFANMGDYEGHVGEESAVLNAEDSYGLDDIQADDDVEEVDPSDVQFVDNAESDGVQDVDDIETEQESDIEDEGDLVPDEEQDQDLIDGEEDEEEADEEGDFLRSGAAGSVASGLVQFELVPVASSLPSGVTVAQARTALMNVQSVTHNLFSTATAAKETTYVNGAFGRDAIYLGETSNRYQIMVSGFVGWVDKQGPNQSITLNIGGTNRTIQYRVSAVYYPFGSYAAGQGRSALLTEIPTEINLLQHADQTIPFVEDDELMARSSATEVRSASYYVNRNGTMIRVLSGNVAGTLPSAPWGHTVGPAPSWMTQNTAFYSYDGVYFYRNPRDIRVDGAGAVNAGNPHYNYFQYLSLRSHTNYNATQLNNFISSRLTATERSNSKMVGTGANFMNSQTTYGVNAMLQFAFAIHESNRGLSSIAINNNNLFGINAVDSNPAGNANAFQTVEDGITEHANRWMSRGYLNPADWRYGGPHLGNKGSGMNIRYASDPYWGEKIAGWAFQIDSSTNNSDINHYTIGVLQNTSSVSVNNASGSRLYTANAGGFRHFPFLITGNDGNRRRIRTDAPVVGNGIDHNALYNPATAIGFIPDSNLRIVNGKGGGGTPNPNPDPDPTPTPNPTPNPNPNPTDPIPGGTREGQTTARLNLRTGPGTNHSVIRTLPQGQTVTILSESNGWMNVRVGNETGWVSAEFVKVINDSTPNPTPTPTPPATREGQTTERLNFRSGPGTNHSIIRTLPLGQTVTILSESNGWMNVRVGNETGWVSAQYIKVNNDSTPTPTPNPTPATREGQTTERLNFRSGPGTNHSIIRTLPLGQTVTILSESNGWMNVRVGNETGWVSAQYIKINNDSTPTPNPTPATRQGQTTGRLNFRSGPGTNHSIIRTLPLGQTVTILSESNGWMNVRVGTETGWVSAQYVRVTDGNGNTAATRQGQTTGRLNFRSGPGTNHSIIRTLPLGQTVTILSESNGWMNVRVGTETGWVSAEYIRVTNGSTAIREGQTTENLNLRTGAGTNHRIIRTLPRGTTITILSESNGWMQVRVGTETGWVSAQYVK